MQYGTLYVFHGSPAASCYHAMQQFGQQLLAATPNPAAIAFLAHSENTILPQIKRLAAAGVRQLKLQPVLLMPAVHFSRDLVPLVPRAAAIGVDLQLYSWIGETKSVQQSLENTINQLTPPENSCGIILAHGSRKYPSVEARLQGVVAKIQRSCPQFPLFDGYLLSEREELTFEARLASLQTQYQHIFVLPFFIFYGHLLEKIAKIVDDNHSYHVTIKLMPNLDLNLVANALLQEGIKC